jgi:hypothetical protein
LLPFLGFVRGGTNARIEIGNRSRIGAAVEEWTVVIVTALVPSVGACIRCRQAPERIGVAGEPKAQKGRRVPAESGECVRCGRALFCSLNVILLHVAELGVAVAAHDYCIVGEGVSGDVVEF